MKQLNRWLIIKVSVKNLLPPAENRCIFKKTVLQKAKYMKLTLSIRQLIIKYVDFNHKLKSCNILLFNEWLWIFVQYTDTITKQLQNNLSIIIYNFFSKISAGKILESHPLRENKLESRPLEKKVWTHTCLCKFLCIVINSYVMVSCKVSLEVVINTLDFLLCFF